MMKRILNVLIGLLPLLLILCFLYWIIYKPAGLRLVISALPKLVSGQLIVKQANGTLAHEIILQDVSYQDNLLHFTAKNINIQWQPKELINHNILSLQTLTINAGSIDINHYKPAKKSEWPHLPFAS